MTRYAVLDGIFFKRIGRSPDKGDSAVYALAVGKPPQPARFFRIDFMQR